MQNKIIFLAGLASIALISCGGTSANPQGLVDNSSSSSEALASSSQASSSSSSSSSSSNGGSSSSLSESSSSDSSSQSSSSSPSYKVSTSIGEAYDNFFANDAIGAYFKIEDSSIGFSAESNLIINGNASSSQLGFAFNDLSADIDVAASGLSSENASDIKMAAKASNFNGTFSLNNSSNGNQTTDEVEDLDVSSSSVDLISSEEEIFSSSNQESSAPIEDGYFSAYISESALYADFSNSCIQEVLNNIFLGDIPAKAKLNEDLFATASLPLLPSLKNSLAYEGANIGNIMETLSSFALTAPYVKASFDEEGALSFSIELTGDNYATFLNMASRLLGSSSSFDLSLLSNCLDLETFSLAFQISPEHVLDSISLDLDIPSFAYSKSYSLDVTTSDSLGNSSSATIGTYTMTGEASLDLKASIDFAYGNEVVVSLPSDFSDYLDFSLPISGESQA